VRPRRAVWAYATFALAAVATAFFVGHEARAIAFPYPLDYGEGPLLEQARRLTAGENIYSPTLEHYPFTIANYPPLFPLLLGVAGHLGGWTLASARLLTFAAAAACAALVTAIARAAGASRGAALVGGALFLANPYVVFWSTLVRIDLVALAFSLGALLVVVRGPRDTRRLLVAGALVLLAALTRQSHLLAAPAAIAVGLVFERRARAAAFVAGFASAVALVTVALAAATHGGFLLHTVTANRNAYSVSLLQYFAGDFAQTSGLLAALAAASAVLATRGLAAPVRATLAAYFPLTLLSALTIGKVGSHVNYFLELVAASSVLCGVALCRAHEQSTPAWRSFGVWTTATACLGIGVGHSLLRPENMEAKLRRRADFDALAQVLRREPGRVLADETMGMLVLTGHRIELQPFEFTQLARQGLWDDSPVVRDLQDGSFGLVLVNDGPETPASWTRDRWTASMLAALHARYTPAGALGGATLYRPTGAPSP
jgi:hypothetical protein